MSSQTRMKFFFDESRVWNMSSDLKMRKSFMVGYLYDTRIMESMLAITGLSMNLWDMTEAEKKMAT